MVETCIVCAQRLQLIPGTISYYHHTNGLADESRTLHQNHPLPPRTTTPTCWRKPQTWTLVWTKDNQ